MITIQHDYVKRTSLLMGSVQRGEKKDFFAVVLLHYNVETTSFTDKPRNGHTLNRLYKCLIYCSSRLAWQLSGIKYFTPTIAVEFNVQRFDVLGPKQDINQLEYKRACYISCQNPFFRVFKTIHNRPVYAFLN